MTGAFETIRYAAEGPVATITLARPNAANAQNSQLIYELDAAFDRADEMWRAELRATTIADLVMSVVQDAPRAALEKGARWLGVAVRG